MSKKVSLILSSFHIPVMQAAKTHLAYGANPRIIDFNDNTALKHAPRHGDADMVTLLLRKEMSDTPDWYEAPLLGAVKEVGPSCMCSFSKCHVRNTWMVHSFNSPAKGVDKSRYDGGLPDSVSQHVT